MSYHLANYLSENGSRVVFISKKPYFDQIQHFKKENGELILCSWPSKVKSTSLRDFIWFREIYQKYRPSFVIGHHNGSITSIMASKILSLGKVKTLEYYHTCSDQYIADKNGLSLRLRLFLFRRFLFFHLFCDRVICPSVYADQDLKSYFNFHFGRVILNPLSDRYQGARLKKETDNILISYLGRLDPTKNVVELISAFRQYLHQTTDSKIRLRIAGSGLLEKEIQVLIKGNAFIDYVGYLSYDRIDQYIGESQFVIVPSKFDNLPTVSLEALMNGVPLLISETVGTSHYLSHGLDSFIFSPEIEAMIGLFSRVEQCSREDLNRMSTEARSTFLRLFRIQEYFTAIEETLLDVSVSHS
ncbi:glycosyltransferase family 4 protein [Algoriphagus litoralis]|uniref:glycosyltransferase family 4 protein n=1 Tax=Algoriphagus litoralis TaxID=2202829 RepID=UPI0018E5685B|nr:glycosyltransferase family 4 protein [Algoriphagus litoralis]